MNHLQKNNLENRIDILSDEDIESAMSDLHGFVDITTEDFRFIYNHAFLHAADKLKKETIPAKPVSKEKLNSSFFTKLKGHAHPPARVSLREMVWSWIGGFLGIAAVSILNYLVLSGTDILLLIGSFGASAVLVYGAIRSPLAQPRNLVGGHIVSAISGVLFYTLLPGIPWLAGSLAVATAIFAMHFTKTLHPPGGATALIAVIVGDSIHKLGFLYVLFPAAAGAMILLLVGLFVNNLDKERQYPEFWY